MLPLTLAQVNALSAYGLLDNMGDPWQRLSPPQGVDPSAPRTVWLANTAGGSLLGRHLISLAKTMYSRGSLRVKVVAVVRRAEQRQEVLDAGCALFRKVLWHDQGISVRPQLFGRISIWAGWVNL